MSRRETWHWSTHKRLAAEEWRWSIAACSTPGHPQGVAPSSVDDLKDLVLLTFEDNMAALCSTKVTKRKALGKDGFFCGVLLLAVFSQVLPTVTLQRENLFVMLHLSVGKKQILFLEN
jgi:hypothetical protein